MAPEYARRFMELQAQTYAKRVLAKQINSSAVETLLEGDAEMAADSSRYIRGYIEHGLTAFRSALNGSERT